MRDSTGEICIQEHVQGAQPGSRNGNTGGGEGPRPQRKSPRPPGGQSNGDLE